jgi:hypothetical protein
MSIVTCRSHRSSTLLQNQKRQVTENLFHYIGGTTGSWRVSTIASISGMPLPPVTHIDIAHGALDRAPAGANWVLHCIASNTRFVTREEPRRLPSDPPRMGRFSESCAALVLVRKSRGWWNLGLSEQQQMLEVPSRNIRGRLSFLPAMMRRMQYRTNVREPFDFVTWFEYAPQDASIFDDLVTAMRSSEDWHYVEREIVIKMVSENQ